MNSKRDTLLVLSQVYPPDPASVGQHIADTAAAMAARRYRVRVITSARGYDDPSVKFAKRETRDGVVIRRLPLSSFGKSSIPIRLIAGFIFIAQAIIHGLFTRRLGAILVSTSPPMCPIAAVVIGRLRGVPITHWAMDLNPDQMIALKKIKEGSLPARAFDWINRLILRNARDVVALDRFMAERLRRKLDVSHKVTVMPPWPHEDKLEAIRHVDNPFRKAHGLDGKFVVMYSGNHGPSNPISTAIRAARKLHNRPDIVWMFIGGGVGKKEVDAAIADGATNIVSLPYQPFSEIRYSLSAADVHLVTVGDDIVGIVHPCKVYGAMAVARPVILLGPEPSHVADLLDKHGIGWRVRHGDAEGMALLVERLAAMPPEKLHEMGLEAQRVIGHELSKNALCGRLCDIIERGLRAGRMAHIAPVPPGASRAGE